MGAITATYDTICYDCDFAETIMLTVAAIRMQSRRHRNFRRKAAEPMTCDRLRTSTSRPTFVIAITVQESEF